MTVYSHLIDFSFKLNLQMSKNKSMLKYPCSFWMILNALSGDFATFKFVSLESLFVGFVKCLPESCKLVMPGRYVLFAWSYSGHSNTKCISVSWLFTKNGHVVWSVVGKIDVYAHLSAIHPF